MPVTYTPRPEAAPSPTAPLYELELHDKPTGYGLGTIAGKPAAVQPCPQCKQPGARVSERLVLHRIRYFEVIRQGRRQPELDTSVGCKLSDATVSAHPWKR